MNSALHSSPAPHSISLPSATPPVGLGILGLNFGEGIARLIQRQVPPLQVVAVCDANEGKARSLGQELAVPAYVELEALLQDPKVEAVGLFTGPCGRAALISKILRAGKHVLTTKPFELDPAAAAAVLQEASDRGLIIHQNSPASVVTEDLSLIKSWREEYDLGRPLALQARTWASYRESANGTWYDDPVLCPVAPILRLGIYFLNDFATILGQPYRVFVQQSRIFTNRPTVDHAQISLEYTNGALASIFASFCVNDGRPYQDEVTLNFANGTIRRSIQRQNGPDMSGDFAVLELQTKGKSLVHRCALGNYCGWYQWDGFARAVRGDRSIPRTQDAEVLQGIQLLQAAGRSSISGSAEVVASGVGQG